MEENKNWMVVLNTKRGTELKGVYPTKRAALFISQRIKFSEKINYYPQVVPTDADLYPPDNKVEDWLQHLDKQKQKAKYLTKVHRP